MKRIQDRKSFAEILDSFGEEPLRRVLEKVPGWKGVEGLKVPSLLNAEQCSSAHTALYKASLASRIAGPAARVADLTGGLGVDSYFLSRVASEVLYLERDPRLCEAAGSNFALLGTCNIKILNTTCGPDTGTKKLLQDFAPDLIYLDPARRSAAGRKVFLPEDCEPDITAMLPMLLECAPAVMVKVSPMADIALLRKRFGASLKEIHLVQHKGELKEMILLFTDARGQAPGLSITVAIAGTNETLSFDSDDEARSEAAYADEASVTEGSSLFEPGAALAKSGAFRLLCSRFGLRALSNASHLYTGAVPDELKPFGKIRTVRTVLPFGKSSVKQLFGTAAEVSARGIPMTSDQLRRRLGCPSGGEVHIFGVSLRDGTRRLIVCNGAPTSDL